MALTNRSLKAAPVRVPPAARPYARTTGSQLMRTTLRAPLEAQNDERAVKGHLASAMADHEDTLRNERATSPDRFSTGLTLRQNPRSPPRKMAGSVGGSVGSPTGRQDFTMRVSKPKQITVSISKLHAQHGNTLGGAGRAPPDPAAASGASSFGGGGGDSPDDEIARLKQTIADLRAKQRYD